MQFYMSVLHKLQNVSQTRAYRVRHPRKPVLKNACLHEFVWDVSGETPLRCVALETSLNYHVKMHVFKSMFRNALGKEHILPKSGHPPHPRMSLGLLGILLIRGWGG